MCGIVGVALPARAPVDPAVVRQMTGALVHRGPDGEGTFFADGVGFGHRRLSIVDLTDAARQPMVSEAGSALTYNGEVYNYVSLREDLARASRTVRSSGDTEVLLAALDVWGEAALARVEGMFAFGYWSEATRSLLLARDRFGEKPLYYSLLGEGGRDGIVFASELRALALHPRVLRGRLIDPVAVAQFFLHEHVPAPRSIFENVNKLPAGCSLRWQEGRPVRVTPYASQPYASPSGPGEATVNELKDDLVRRVEASTRARLVADVPVGVFLSGGLDSSFIAACATRVHPRVRTFAVAFDDPSFDESEHARLVADHLGTDHTELRLQAKAMCDLVPSVLDWMDEPFADSSLVPMTLLAREVRKEVTVALGGDGGDELLAGYPTFVVGQALSAMPPWPMPAAALARFALARLPHRDGNFSLSFNLRQLAQGLDQKRALRHPSWLAPLLPGALAGLAGPRLTEHAALTHAFDAAESAMAGAPTAFDAATAFYLKLYLGEGVLTKVDRATMRASLEARAPLLDSGVAELCLALPRRFRVRGRVTKWLMRKAIEPMVPASIVARPKKGFGAPVGQWLRGPLRALAEDILRPTRVRDGGWLDPKAVTRMLRAHIAGTRDHRKALWAVLVFEHWRQRWM